MKKERGGMTDRTLALLVVLLAAAGLALLYSTSMYNGRVRFQDPAYYFKKTAVCHGVGFPGLLYGFAYGLPCDDPVRAVTVWDFSAA